MISAGSVPTDNKSLHENVIVITTNPSDPKQIMALDHKQHTHTPQHITSQKQRAVGESDTNL
jgi:hypothetical protein